MASSAQLGDVLWEPSEAAKERANLTSYMRWLREHKGLDFADMGQLWRWSVTELEAFWGSIWEYFDVQATRPYTTVLAERRMPGARWFVGAELNYAAHIFRAASPDRPALLYCSEREPLREMSWDELRQQVAALAATLRRCGVERGDRVAAYLPNTPQAVVGVLACASIGAVWSSCSPDFGAASCPRPLPPDRAEGAAGGGWLLVQWPYLRPLTYGGGAAPRAARATRDDPGPRCRCHA